MSALSKFVSPWYPATAVGIDKGIATMVHLESGRGNSCNLRRAATISLEESLLTPSFQELNIANQGELVSALRELATGAGLRRQKRWSVALPEATSRTLILALESQPGSASELEEILIWKIERSFGVPVAELTLSRERLPADTQERERYIVVAVRTAVLEQYENVFAALGWRAGLILPRHMGEAEWLTRNGAMGDSLLLSSFGEGFTAVVFRGKQPLIMRTIACEPQEREDELYRLLLFYRDRRLADSEGPGQLLSRLLVIGAGLSGKRASEIVNETLATSLRPLTAEDLGLRIPSADLSFETIAAPAGLATLSCR